jgi:hypothetical protein
MTAHPPPRAFSQLLCQLLILSLLAFASCQQREQADAAPRAEVASVQLSTDSVRLGQGQTLQLQALVRDAQGHLLPNRAIVWHTDPGPVATVSSTGLLHLLSEGTTTLTATCEGHQATAQVRAYALLPLYRYVSFQNAESLLQPWAGARVVLLTPSSALDPRLMQRLVSTLDGGYDYYRLVTGKEPSRHPVYTYQGKGTVASVAQTCGVACGKIGSTGIEMVHPWVSDFWFYWDQLYFTGCQLDVATGYSHLMKYMAADYLRLPLSALEAEQRRAMEDVASEYLRTPGWSWERVVSSGQAPAAAGSPVGGQLLFAGLLLRLQEQYGGQAFILRLWQEIGQRPRTSSLQDAVDNLALGACAGANKNLLQVLTRDWRFAVSSAATQEAQARFGAPI